MQLKSMFITLKLIYSFKVHICDILNISANINILKPQNLKTYLNFKNISKSPDLLQKFFKDSIEKYLNKIYNQVYTELITTNI